jgi:hypothetical protein
MPTRRFPPRLILGAHLRRRAPARLLLKIENGESYSPSSEMRGWLMPKSAKSSAMPLFTMIATAVVVATWAIVVVVHTYGP